MKFFFTSKKTITIVNVLFVPDMNRNFINGDFLSKSGIKVVFESSKLILSKFRNFVGNGYLVIGISSFVPMIISIK